jgi:hypothetical protein
MKFPVVRKRPSHLERSEGRATMTSYDVRVEEGFARMRNVTVFEELGFNRESKEETMKRHPSRVERIEGKLVELRAEASVLDARLEELRAGSRGVPVYEETEEEQKEKLNAELKRRLYSTYGHTYTLEDLNKFGKKINFRFNRGPWSAAFRTAIRFAKGLWICGTPYYDFTGIPHIDETRIGAVMENSNELSTALVSETKTSKEELEKLANQVTALGNIIVPQLMKLIQEVRDSRQAMVSELKQMLSSLQGVREFFLDSDYEIEMARLERFVTVCKDIQRLKAEGVFDAVVDSAVRLAVKEDKHER